MPPLLLLAGKGSTVPPPHGHREDFPFVMWPRQAKQQYRRWQQIALYQHGMATVISPLTNAAGWLPTRLRQHQRDGKSLRELQQLACLKRWWMLK